MNFVDRFRRNYRTPALVLQDCVTLPLWKTLWADHIEYLGYRARNWGDALNPVLIERLSGKRARGIDFHMIEKGRAITLKDERYAVVGSTLQLVDEDTVVWGVGFWRSDTPIPRPKEVRAVRGPLTRKRLLDAGIDCPEVYGDPALLYPRFYDPPQQIKYELGVVPHFVDEDRAPVARYREEPNVLVIDIRGGINEVVDQIKSCAAIASSSLHGLIAAAAYGRPAVWVKFSNALYGDDFKFYDYFASMGVEDVEPLWIETPLPPRTLIDRAHLPEMLDLDKLVSACPFA